MQANRKRIAVIGMGRSGTSVLTQLLSNCGVYTGNESGKYEHPVGRKINDTILEEMFGAKRGLPYGKLPEADIDVPSKWHEEVKKFIDLMDRETAESGKWDMWAFKDPRTTILHKLWLQHFDIVIGIFRNPAHVVESYMAKKWIKGFFKREKALDYWKRFNKSLISIYRELNGVKPVYILDFNHDVRSQFIRMCAQIGLKADEQTLKPFDERRGKPSIKPVTDITALTIYAELKKIRNLV